MTTVNALACAKYRAAHPDRVRERNAQQYARIGPEYKAAWRAANPDKKYVDGRTSEQHSERGRAYRAANSERVAARNALAVAAPGYNDSARAYRAANIEKVKTIELRSRAKRLGVDPATIPPKAQCCEVCGSTKKICFDHCHATKRFRGWLCDRCNVALGNAKDDPAVLRALADYLEQRRES